jgi:hypothetical protein
MSFKDLVEVRTKRAEKEANKLTKKKRACGRKRKGSAAEACMLEPMIQAACTDKAPEPVELPIQDMEGSLMLARRRAPVARDVLKDRGGQASKSSVGLNKIVWLQRPILCVWESRILAQWV